MSRCGECKLGCNEKGVLLCEENLGYEQCIDRLQDALYAVDRPQEWIPCSERLPSEQGLYLTTYPLVNDRLWVGVLWYGKPTFPEKDEPCFYASDDEYGDVEYSDVIAWMPLPEPYCGADIGMKGADDEKP